MPTEGDYCMPVDKRYTHANQEQKRRAVDTLVPRQASKDGEDQEDLLHGCDRGSQKPVVPLSNPLFSMN